MDLAAKVDKVNLQIKVPTYCAALMGAAHANCTATHSAVLAAMSAPPVGPNLFRGKDVIALAAVALRSKAGTLPAAAASEAILSAALRSSAGQRVNSSQWIVQLKRLVGS